MTHQDANGRQESKIRYLAEIWDNYFEAAAHLADCHRYGDAATALMLAKRRKERAHDDDG